MKKRDWTVDLCRDNWQLWSMTVRAASAAEARVRVRASSGYRRGHDRIERTNLKGEVSP